MPVTLFNYPKWPLKFFVQGNEAWCELNPKTAELRWYAYLVPFLGTKLYPKVQKFTKKDFLANYTLEFVQNGNSHKQNILLVTYAALTIY